MIANDSALPFPPVSGRVDRACGLVFRYQDENTYYLTRANALEDNVRFCYVKDGRRIQLANWSGKVTSRAFGTSYGSISKGSCGGVLGGHEADRRAPPHVQSSRPRRRVDQGRLLHVV